MPPADTGPPAGRRSGNRLPGLSLRRALSELKASESKGGGEAPSEGVPLRPREAKPSQKEEEESYAFSVRDFTTTVDPELPMQRPALLSKS